MKLYDMKLYSVFTLYVVQKGNTKFICKKGNKENTYVEFFTKEKFIVENKNEIESLSSYYSLLEVANYTTNEPLMLSKKQILQKYLMLNEKELDNNDYKDTNVEMWQDYVESKKDTLHMPIINVKELIKKNRNE